MRHRYLMILKRVSRNLVSLSLSISLALALIAVPATSLAALPLVHTGFGTDSGAAVQPTTGAIPPTVRPGEPVAFQVWARNDDTSTVSQFYLKAATAGTLTSATWHKSSGQSGTCVGTSTYDCSFGQLKPQVTVYVTAVFTTPTAGSSMGVNFVFSTTGLGSGTGDNSHGDTFQIPDSVALNSDADFGGRYITGSTLKTVQNDQTLGSGNKQSTIVYSPATGIGVTVEDGPGVSSGCASGCFGETSEIHVGNGSSQYGAFKVVVNLHSSEIPSGVNANNIVVYHDGVAITTTCGKTPVADCYSVKKFSWGLQVTIWLLHNGKLNMG
jgi:hypothetical protein